MTGRTCKKSLPPAAALCFETRPSVGAGRSDNRVPLESSSRDRCIRNLESLVVFCFVLLGLHSGSLNPKLPSNARGLTVPAIRTKFPKEKLLSKVTEVRRLIRVVGTRTFQRFVFEGLDLEAQGFIRCWSLF